MGSTNSSSGSLGIMVRVANLLSPLGSRAKAIKDTNHILAIDSVHVTLLKATF